MLSKVVIASAIVASASGSSEHWAYANYCNVEDVRGVAPDQWNQLNTAYAPCVSSVAGDQTPIDIDCGVATEDGAYSITYQPTNAATVKNNGHAIQVDLPAGNGAVITTNIVSLTSATPNAATMATYNAAQMHVHWQKTDSTTSGSEHSIDGAFYPMEMHFVNYHSRYADLTAAVTAGVSDSLQVYGVMFEIGDTGNAGLQLLIDALGATGIADGASATLGNAFDPCAFIEGGCGAKTEFSFYNGGLTTPPCNSAAGSIVQWAVSHTNSKISQTQLDWFKTQTFAGTPVTGDTAELISKYGNSRPIQPRGQRDIYVKGSTGPSTTCAKAAVTGPWTEPTNATIPSCPETMSPTMSPTTSSPTASTTVATTTTPSSAVNNVANVFVAVVASIFVALF